MVPEAVHAGPGGAGLLPGLHLGLLPPLRTQPDRGPRAQDAQVIHANPLLWSRDSVTRRGWLFKNFFLAKIGWKSFFKNKIFWKSHDTVAKYVLRRECFDLQRFYCLLWKYVQKFVKGTILCDLRTEDPRSLIIRSLWWCTMDQLYWLQFFFTCVHTGTVGLTPKLFIYVHVLP